MKIKCVITDDEPIARKGLRGYIEKTDFLTLTGECENALQLNELLKKEQPELLFMDIEMPYINGIDFLSGIHNPPKKQPSKVPKSSSRQPTSSMH